MGRHRADENPDGVPASTFADVPYHVEIAGTLDESTLDPAAIPAITQPFPLVRMRHIPDMPATQPQPVAHAHRPHAVRRRVD